MALPKWLAKRRTYCSKKCYGLGQKKDSYLKNKKECLICKTAFKKGSASVGKYCSPECYARSLVVRGDKPKCVDCGKELTAHGSERCAQCFYQFRRGENHPNWKGGISNREIHSLNNPKYKEWRMNVFARDGFKCRIANKDCSGTLQAHHILRWAEYPELRYDITNGITLCVGHHPRKKAEEQRLEPLFRKLLD